MLFIKRKYIILILLISSFPPLAAREKPVNVGEPLNSEADELYPTLTRDGKTVIFNSKRGELKYHDIFISTKNSEGKWAVPRPLVVINSPYNDETPFITPEGDMILFASDRDGSFEMQKDSKGRIRISYDLYRSVKQSDGSWGKPEKIPGNVNSRKHERFPSLSPDRKTIFYSSWDFGHLDSIQLMRADVTPRGYSEARPLSQINQSAREIQFVYDPSQSGFHFASAREGYGGWDLFFVPFSAGQFGAVINMGANYNTEFHDMSMAVAGSQMMISSNRPGGVGGYDLYFSEGSEKSSRIFAFRITDEKSKNSLGGKVKIFIKKADIPLPDARGALIEKSVKEDGKLDVKISEKVEQIQVVVETEGYLPYSQVFNTIQMPTTQIDLPMIPLKKDAKLVVHDIHFDYDSAILKDESRQILDSLIRFLNQYPKVKLLITGHTDLHGEAKYNQILSEERASAVRDHLVDAGIEKQRFRLQGAGKSMPLKNGLGPGFDEINRRTEFEIIQLK